jgi:hypothetical protein
MITDMKRPLTIGFAVLLSAGTAAAAQGAKRDVDRLPALVTQAIQANKPGAEIDKLEIEKESGITLYDIEFKAGRGEIEVAEDGTVMDVTTIVEENDVPEAAATAIKAAANGKRVKQYERSEVRAEIVKEGGKGRISPLSRPKYVYEAELTKGEVEVTADGKVIKATEKH